MRPRPVTAVRSVPALALGLLWSASPAPAQCEFRFGPEQLARPLDGLVFAATVWDPDAGGPRPPSLVVGGHDLAFMDQLFFSIAMYEDGQWGPVGAALPAGTGLEEGVRALTVFNGDLIAGGTFVGTFGGPPTLRRIARFNGTDWLPFGQGMDGPVNALAVLNGALFAAGEFSTAGGIPAARVARWDGSSWTPLGQGISGTDDIPRAMTGFGGALYVGGDLSSAGGVPVSNIAVWDGAGWSSPGLGANDTVRALSVHNSATTPPTLVMGGDFTIAGGIPAQHIAVRSALGQWTALGAGVEHPVWALLVRNVGLTGYSVTAATRTPSGAGDIRQFSGGVWSALGSFPGGSPTCIVYHDFQYTVGNWGWGSSANTYAFDGAGWAPVGPGLSGSVTALQPYGPDLIFGGDFEYAHGQRVNHVARWDGTRWDAMDGGMNGEVLAFTVFQNALYVSGAFTAAGSATTNNIARWDGAAWHPAGLPGPASGPVWALADFNGELIVGGALDSGRLVSRRAGNTWVDMSAGLTPVAGELVRTFAVWNGDLYAGATAPIIGSANRSAIARWDAAAQQWVQVQADPTAASNHRIHRLVPFGGTLYAAGRNLGQLGGFCALASVNPSSFQALWQVTQTFPQPALGRTLTVYDGKLYLTGTFDRVDLFHADGFARREPTWWMPIDPPFAQFAESYAVPSSAATVYQGDLVYGLVHLLSAIPEFRWVRWHCPAACYADCNADGALTVADFGCFQTKFVAGDPYADCSADGLLTVADFGCFQTKFVTGCP